ncbi:alpha/beta hydrolase [bacterium]|nr:alpha/beta hydrolase [bacterium]
MQLYSSRGGFNLASRWIVRSRIVSIGVAVFSLLWSSPALSGVRSCEELTALLANKYHLPVASDTPLEWPKSITQNSVELARKIEAEFLPLYRRAQHDYFITSDKTALAYSYFRAAPESLIQGTPRGTLVISHGLGESRPQWLDQIKTFIQEGYDVYIYEHRGQAHSDRPLPNHFKVHVNRFKDYENDMHEFVSEVVKPNARGTIYGVGFSLGGLVATFNTIHHPEDFSALVAIAPAYQIKTRDFPAPIVKGVVDLMVLLGKGEEYSFFQKDFSEEKLDLLRRHTHDADRWQTFLRVLEMYPMTAPGGLTHRWLSEVLGANLRVQREMVHLRKPTLVLEAGADGLIRSEITHKIASRHPWISHYYDPKSFHSMIHDSDSIRNPALTEVIRYLVHPERLDQAAGRSSWEFLQEQSLDFSRRDEIAFSRYAAEEAERRWRVEHPFEILPQSLQTLLKNSQRHLEASSEGQKGLYVFLKAQREKELKKLYPKTP